MPLLICKIARCEERHTADKTMCRDHWRMCPPQLRLDVERAQHQWLARKDDRNRMQTYREEQRKAVAAVDAIVLAARRAARTG